MNFTEITQALKEVSKITSTTEKQNWLKNHDDKDFKYLLSWYFDNSYCTGIAEKKFDKIQSLMPDFVGTRTFEDAINYLKTHQTGSDEDVRFVKMIQEFICKDDEEKETFRKLVCKSYAMGINTSTINKVFPGLIPTFDVALCNKLQDYPKLLDGNTEYEISIKIDGCRCVAFKENGKVRLISRQGKVWEGCNEVEDAIKTLPRDNFVFDGELTIKDFMNYPSDQVYKLTTKIISSKEPDKKGICLNVFDVMSIDEWNSDSSKVQSERRKELDALMIHNTSDALFDVAPMYVGKDPEMVSKYMKEFVEPNNYEGLVLKLTNSKYEHKRTKAWLKVKQMETYDLTIKGYFEGKGNFEGTLGGFECEVTLPDGKFVEAKVGSGYSVEERNTIWQNPESYIGKNIEVQGFELTQNQNDSNYSIRFPVFKGFIPEGKELNGDYKS